MDLPEYNTIKILEERKTFLENKNTNRNSFVLAEIGALNRVINLIKLVQNNFSDDILRKIINETETNDNNQEVGGAEYEIVYSFDKEITKNSKLDISFIQNKDEKQIIIALKKFKREYFKWVYQGKIKTTVKILEEIIEESNKIWKK